MAITSEQRKKVESLIYASFSKVDKTGVNTEYYKKLFSTLSDREFEKMFQSTFPIKYQHKPFENEPSIADIKKGLDIIGVPLTEKITMPYKYSSPTKGSVNSKETLVGYIHLKKMKQLVTKKNSMSTDIATRDMKTGLLVDFDKNGKSSDRELEGLLVLGSEATVKEFARPRADAMIAKDYMYNEISNKGEVSLKDIPIDEEDSLAKNLANIYFTGAHLYTNLLNKDYLLPHTLKKNKNLVSRI